jgi:hypothetical protein
MKILVINGPSRVGKSTMVNYLLETRPGLAVLDPSRALKCWYMLSQTKYLREAVCDDYLYGVGAGRDPYEIIAARAVIFEESLLTRYEQDKASGVITRKDLIGFAELMRTADPAYWVKAAYKMLEEKLYSREYPIDLLWVEAINQKEWGIMSNLLTEKWPDVWPTCISLNCTNPSEVVEQDSRAGDLFVQSVTYKIEESLRVADWLYKMGLDSQQPLEYFCGV